MTYSIMDYVLGYGFIAVAGLAVLGKLAQLIVGKRRHCCRRRR